jgi:hypothetical protein
MLQNGIPTCCLLFPFFKVFENVKLKKKNKGCKGKIMPAEDGHRRGGV